MTFYHPHLAPVSTQPAHLSQQGSAVDFLADLVRMCPAWVRSVRMEKDEIALTIRHDAILPVFTFLRDHSACQYKCLMDVTAVDYPSKAARFTVVYTLLSLRYNSRLVILAEVPDLTPVDSLVGLYNSAAWNERETWDMFGIFFAGHPDLRRILTDYGFEGHPLRKDFPMTGYTEVRYDDSEKRVITEALEVTQDFRYFDFASPWELIERAPSEKTA